MTVHGAKGLQAPIVFLPDTCMLPRREGASIYSLVRHGVSPEESEYVVENAGPNDRFTVNPADSLRSE